MTEPLTKRELMLLMAKLSHLVMKSETIRTAIESIVRANEELLLGVTFPETDPQEPLY